MKTFKQIRDFNSTNFLQRNPVNAQTKLGYAITKLASGQISSIIKEYQKAHADAWHEQVGIKSINLALTDKVTGAVLKAPEGSGREYLYDRAGLLEMINAERAFNDFGEKMLEEWDAKEYEIIPHYTSEIPEGITEFDLEVMKGFVIDPSYQLPVKEAVAETATVEA